MGGLQSRGQSVERQILVEVVHRVPVGLLNCVFAEDKLFC